MLKCSSQHLKTHCSLFLLVPFIAVISLLLTACVKQNLTSHTESKSRLALAEARVAEPEHKKAALINVELGLNYLAQEQVARAKHKLIHAVKLAPNTVEPHSALAYFFEKVGDNQEAEREHKKALRIGGGSNGALANNYGAFLYRQNRFREADQAFRHALADKNYAHSAEVNENAGLCALQLADLKLAERYFNAAICQDPKRSQALLELAAIRLKQQNFQATKTLLLQYHNTAQASARSLLLNIELAAAEKDKKSLLAYAAELKTYFKDSKEYQQYLRSQPEGAKS